MQNFNLGTLEVYEASTMDDIQAAKNLFLAYEKYVNDHVGTSLCFQGFEKELNQLPAPYNPPDGIILLARINAHVIGCVALKKHTPPSCEVKRLFVDINYHSYGIGKRLMLSIMDKAVKLGYKTLKLNLLNRNQAAYFMYQSLGFTETAPYDDDFKHYAHIVYMHYDLSQ